MGYPVRVEYDKTGWMIGTRTWKLKAVGPNGQCPLEINRSYGNDPNANWRKFSDFYNGVRNAGCWFERADCLDGAASAMGVGIPDDWRYEMRIDERRTNEYHNPRWAPGEAFEADEIIRLPTAAQLDMDIARIEQEQFSQDMANMGQSDAETEAAIARIQGLSKEFAAMLTQLEPLFMEFHDLRTKTCGVVYSNQLSIQAYYREIEKRKAGGHGAALAGGLITIGAICAAPWTGGTSLLAIGAGAALGIGGGVSNFANEQALSQHVKNMIHGAEGAMHADEAATQALMDHVNHINQWQADVKSTLRNLPDMSVDDQMNVLVNVSHSILADVEFYKGVVVKGGGAALKAGKVMDAIAIGRAAWSGIPIDVAVAARARYGVEMIKGINQGRRGAMVMNTSMSLSKYSQAGTVMKATKWMGNSATVVKGAATFGKAMAKAAPVLTVISIGIEGYSLFNSISSLVNNTMHEAATNLKVMNQQLSDQQKQIASMVSELSNGHVFVLPVMIKNPINGMYLDVRGGHSDSGTELIVWDRNCGANQVFTYCSDGTLGSGVGPSMVVDVDGANSANGTKVQIWEKNGTDAQKWSYCDGRIHSNIGTVLDCQDGSKGKSVHMWQAADVPQQRWELEYLPVAVSAREFPCGVPISLQGHHGAYLHRLPNGRAACAASTGMVRVIVTQIDGGPFIITHPEDGRNLQCTPDNVVRFENHNQGIWEQWYIERIPGREEYYFVSCHTGNVMQSGPRGKVKCENTNRLGYEQWRVHMA